MIDKRVKNLAEAVSGIADGATILCAGRNCPERGSRASVRPSV